MKSCLFTLPNTKSGNGITNTKMSGDRVSILCFSCSFPHVCKTATATGTIHLCPRMPHRKEWVEERSPLHEGLNFYLESKSTVVSWIPLDTRKLGKEAPVGTEWDDHGWAHANHSSPSKAARRNYPYPWLCLPINS